MQSKVFLLALSALLSFSAAQNVSTVLDTKTSTIIHCDHTVTDCPARSITSSSNGTAHVSTIYSAYTTLITAYPSVNQTAAANSTEVEVTTTWPDSNSASVSYSNITLTAPSLVEGTSSVVILAATGTPTPGIVTSYYFIPASSVLAQETSGTENAAAATSSGTARQLSGSGAGILGVVGIMGYLAI